MGKGDSDVTLKQALSNAHRQTRVFRKRLAKQMPNGAAVTNEMIETAKLKSNTDRIISIISSICQGKTVHNSINHSTRYRMVRFPLMHLKRDIAWLKFDREATETVPLTEEIFAFAEYVSLRYEEIVCRKTMLLEIEDAITTRYPTYQVVPFGSYPAGLSIFLSDLDVSIVEMQQKSDSLVRSSLCSKIDRDSSHRKNVIDLSRDSSDDADTRKDRVTGRKRVRDVTQDVDVHWEVDPIGSRAIQGSSSLKMPSPGPERKLNAGSTNATSVTFVHASSSEDESGDAGTTGNGGFGSKRSRKLSDTDLDISFNIAVQSSALLPLHQLDSNHAAALPFRDSGKATRVGDIDIVDIYDTDSSSDFHEDDDFEHWTDGDRNTYPKENHNIRVGFGGVFRSEATDAAAIKKSQLDILRPLSNYIGTLAWTKSLELRSRARVPIINLRHRSDLECDIGMGISAGDTSGLVHQLLTTCGSEEAFVSISAFLKVFLWLLDLDQPFVGGIGSYKLYVMIAYVISRSPRDKLGNGRRTSTFEVSSSSSSSSSIWAVNYKAPDLGYLLMKFFGHFGNRSNLNETTVLKVAGAEISFDKTRLVMDCQVVFRKAYDALASALSARSKGGEDGTSSSVRKSSENLNSSQSLLGCIIDAKELASKRQSVLAKCARVPLLKPEGRIATASSILAFIQSKHRIAPTMTYAAVCAANPMLAGKLRAFESFATVSQLMNEIAARKNAQPRRLVSNKESQRKSKKSKQNNSYSKEKRIHVKR